jgi:hypothetical protein
MESQPRGGVLLLEGDADHSIFFLSERHVQCTPTGIALSS